MKKAGLVVLIYSCPGIVRLLNPFQLEVVRNADCLELLLAEAIKVIRAYKIKIVASINVFFFSFNNGCNFKVSDVFTSAFFQNDFNSHAFAWLQFSDAKCEDTILKTEMIMMFYVSYTNSVWCRANDALEQNVGCNSWAAVEDFVTYDKFLFPTWIASRNDVGECFNADIDTVGFRTATNFNTFLAFTFASAFATFFSFAVAFHKIIQITNSFHKQCTCPIIRRVINLTDGFARFTT
jgi:hypothetical protein